MNDALSMDDFESYVAINEDVDALNKYNIYKLLPFPSGLKPFVCK